MFFQYFFFSTFILCLHKNKIALSSLLYGNENDNRVGSQIFQAWRSFMEEMEQQAKQVRFNSEQLDNLCSDRITQLYQEKRKSRKQFQEEHNKIASQFAHVSCHQINNNIINYPKTSLCLLLTFIYY